MSFIQLKISRMFSFDLIGENVNIFKGFLDKMEYKRNVFRERIRSQKRTPPKFLVLFSFELAINFLIVFRFIAFSEFTLGRIICLLYQLLLLLLLFVFYHFLVRFLIFFYFYFFISIFLSFFFPLLNR